MKTGKVFNHGMLIDSINIKGLIETQSKIPAFIGGKKRVISVKAKTRQKPKVQVKSLRKVRSNLK